MATGQTGTQSRRRSKATPRGGRTTVTEQVAKPNGAGKVNGHDKAKEKPQETPKAPAMLAGTQANENKLAKLSRQYGKIEEKRAELTAEAARIRAEVKEMGGDPATFMYSRKVIAMDPEKRAKIDQTHAMTRRALGHAFGADIQGDLFPGGEHVEH